MNGGFGFFDPTNRHFLRTQSLQGFYIVLYLYVMSLLVFVTEYLGLINFIPH